MEVLHERMQRQLGALAMIAVEDIQMEGEVKLKKMILTHVYVID